MAQQDCTCTSYIIRLERMACNLGFQRMVNDITETMLGSLYIYGKLPTYPSPEPTLTLTSHFGQNVSLGEGQEGSFPEMCGSRKYPYPSHGRLFDLHPPPPRIFRSTGCLITPLPPGISRIFTQGLFLCQSGFGTLKKQKVNTNSFTKIWLNFITTM